MSKLIERLRDRGLGYQHHMDLIDEAATALTAAEEQIDRLREALTPSGETKAEYMGEFEFSIIELDENGDDANRSVTVPWTTIKQIMAAIRARSTLSETGNAV